MNSICDAVKLFEEECAQTLQDGTAAAQLSNALHGSRIENSYRETYFTDRLLHTFRSLGRNNIFVITPPEAATGGDLELHVLHPHERWTGVRFQAKRASKLDGHYKFAELAHTPKKLKPLGKGVQNARLFQRSLEHGMIPLYLYYLPQELTDGKVGWTGAMVGTAWDANHFIESKIASAETILSKNTMSLHHLLCSLDEGPHQFARRIELLLMDHIDPIGQDADLTYDLERLYPGFEEMEDAVFEETMFQETSRTAPPSIKAVFKDGRNYRLSPQVRAAIFIDQSLS